MTWACSVCGKGQRAVLYCRRTDCRGFASKVDLPRPDVSVNTDTDGKTNVTIKRENSERSYVAEGPGMSEKITDVVKKIINDPYTAEWLPGSKR